MFADDSGGGSGGPHVLETFKFNFAIDNQPHDDTNSEYGAASTTISHNNPAPQPDPFTIIPGRLHDPSTLPSTLLFPLQPQHPCAHSRLAITATYSPLRLRAAAAAASGQLAAVVARSDVVPSVYEGGYKVWECAVDLCRHLDRLRSSGAAVDCTRVLELGCGHGLCGLWALLEGGAQHVTFHDLNPEVITDLTVPTVALNLQHHTTPPLNQHDTCAQLHARTTFLSGDWSHPALTTSALLLPPTNSYDLVLTSDTLYSTASIPGLLRLIQGCLSGGGVALVASKRYYFGVGGGTVELARWVAAEGRMECEVVEVLEDGQSNIREVVRLRWKDGRIGPAKGQGEGSGDVEMTDS